MSRLTRIALLLSLVTAVAAPARARTQTPAPPDGTWTGKVTAEMGEMKIVATLKSKDGIVSGQLQTAHGIFTIVKGEFKNGKWVLPFGTEDGGAGKMTGAVNGDLFEGDWDFRPMAVGTFSLKKTPGVVSRTP